MARGTSERDAGLQLAIDKAGGVVALARRLGVKHQNLKWRTAPRGKVFAIAKAAGVRPEEVRPDLADWLRVQERTALLDRARARFGIAGPAVIKSVEEPNGAVVEVFELGVVVFAMRFAAAERAMDLRCLWSAEHHGQAAQSARAYGMALAAVAGRVSTTTIAAVAGGSRQNVDNAAARYLRARDGDAEDAGDDGRVIERGRVRRAKQPDDALWAAERRFLEGLAGE